ncbi:MAG: DUF3095 family protein, partial [Alphaproteobacteria bacterium]|nr:DUF3095 family protein [Alphaproteobacteria bacterium]
MIKQIDSQKFYAELDHFDNFEDFSNPSNYSSVPDDWNVVICDIQGSTNAIAEGRYKEVNMMGASCITAVLNKIKQLDDGRSKGFDIPYVFGGDGTTILVPDQIL